MNRLTDNRLGNGWYQPKDKQERRELQNLGDVSYEELYKALREYENLGLSPKEIMDFYECARMKYKETLDLTKRQQAEIERLTYTLLGVMHSVDKWLEGAELEQDEVNRAATMREKTLQIVEEKRAEIKRLENEVKLLTQNSITEKFPHCVLCGNGVILTKSLDDYDKIIADISSEVVREFQKRLKALYTDELITDNMHCPVAVIKANIDDIAEEMVGKNK